MSSSSSSSGKSNKPGGGRRGSSPIAIPPRRASDTSASYVRTVPDEKATTTAAGLRRESINVPVGSPECWRQRHSGSGSSSRYGSKHDRQNPPAFPQGKLHHQRNYSSHSNAKSEKSEKSERSPLQFRMEELDQSNPGPDLARRGSVSSVDSCMQSPFAETRPRRLSSLAVKPVLPPTPASSYPEEQSLLDATFQSKPAAAPANLPQPPADLPDDHDCDEEFGGKKRKYYVW